MIDHISFSVSDYEKSKKFFETALKPLGYSTLMEYGEIGGLGADNKPDFWIARSEIVPKNHIAFRAESRKQVDEFYESAINAGGKDNGKPGIREHYHPNYYGAFVFDPDGNNVEVVCHKPE